MQAAQSPAADAAQLREQLAKANAQAEAAADKAATLQRLLDAEQAMAARIQRQHEVERRQLQAQGQATGKVAAKQCASTEADAGDAHAKLESR